MKKWLLVLLLALFLLPLEPAVAQRRNRGYWHCEQVVEGRDTTYIIHLLPVYVFSKKADLRRYAKLVNAVKKVYPIAQTAKRRMAEMEAELLRLPTDRARREFLRQLTDEIKEEYTPVLKRMTRTQGRVLIKMIDRETEYTAYEILHEFRGGFVAGFWQGISKLFGHNLKSEFDKEGDDRVLEQIILYYEAGLL